MCDLCNQQPTTLTPPYVLQIAALTEQVAVLTETISTLNITIASQADTIDDLNAALAERDATINALTSAVEELKKDLELWEKQFPNHTCPKCGYELKE